MSGPLLRYLEYDHTFDGRIEVGVVEHEEWGVATELQRHVLDRPGSLGHQLLADLGGAGERDLANDRVGRQLLADRPAAAWT